MLVTNDPTLYETAVTLSNHGRHARQSKQFWPDLLGFKYKMSNIQAAIGCAQLERIDELIAGKRRVFDAYQAALGGLSDVTMNPEPEGVRNGYWMPTAVFGRELGITREHLQAALNPEGIDARVFFHPLSSLPMFEPCPRNVLAYDIPQRAINLPSYHDMTAEDIERVAATVRRIHREARCGHRPA